jgi:hypothetical protein
LEIERTLNLPSFIVRKLLGETSYSAHGRFVFVNSAETQYYVIVEADKESGLANRFGIVAGDF